MNGSHSNALGSAFDSSGSSSSTLRDISSPQSDAPLRQTIITPRDKQVNEIAEYRRLQDRLNCLESTISCFKHSMSSTPGRSATAEASPQPLPEDMVALKSYANPLAKLSTQSIRLIS